MWAASLPTQPKGLRVSSTAVLQGPANLSFQSLPDLRAVHSLSPSIQIHTYLLIYKPEALPSAGSRLLPLSVLSGSGFIFPRVPCRLWKLQRGRSLSSMLHSQEGWGSGPRSSRVQGSFKALLLTGARGDIQAMPPCSWAQGSACPLPLHGYIGTNVQVSLKTEPGVLPLRGAPPAQRAAWPGGLCSEARDS